MAGGQRSVLSRPLQLSALSGSTIRSVLYRVPQSVIIIDGGSDDGSSILSESWTVADPGIETDAVRATRSKGLRLPGDILTYLNSDDYYQGALAQIACLIDLLKIVRRHGRYQSGECARKTGAGVEGKNAEILFTAISISSL
jgi:hypothetical protein